MTSFNISPGDKYDGRCAEIYITEKRFLIFHCSACEEIFATFAELFSHITKDHYENTKELSGEADRKSLDSTHKKENQLATSYSNVKGRKLNDYVERKIANKDDHKFKRCLPETVFQEVKGKNRVEKNTTPLHSNKSLSHRRRLRYTTVTHKSNSSGRNTNALTRYQTIANDERKYVCAICGFAFKEKYNLRGHLMRHSNQNQICCSTCSKNFYTKVELCLHECGHKGGRQYACDRCGKDFGSSISFVQHFRKHHNLHEWFNCGQCLKLSLNSEICANCSKLPNYENLLTNHKELLHTKRITHNKLLNETSKENTKGNSWNIQNDSLKKTKVECDFSFEQSLDEYELVQTLSDLECNKHV